MSVQGVNNYLLTDDVIAKEGLRLLKNSLVAAKLVNRTYEKTFAKVGDTISIKKPFRTKTANGRTLVKQPMIDQTIPLQIDNHKHFGLEITQRDRTLTLTQFSERYLKSGIAQMANDIDKSIFDKMAVQGFFTNAVAGTQIGTKDFLLAKAHQTMVGVPDDSMRRAAMNLMDMAELSDATSKLFNEKIVKESIEKGYMGGFGGYDIFESANISNYKPSAGWSGTPAIKGANQTGDKLVVDGFGTDEVKLTKGDLFTIEGVYEVNPMTRQSTGRLQVFVVTEDTADIATGETQISISPSINDGSLTVTDAEGNTVSTSAYQNVTNKPADNALLTVVGTADNAYRQSFLFHKDAVTLAMVDLELPQSATVKARVRDEESGLSMSMTGGYDIVNHTEITRIDCIWGTKVVYPELLYRMLSAKA